jgi:hypothetical protein
VFFIPTKRPIADATKQPAWAFGCVAVVCAFAFQRRSIVHVQHAGTQSTKTLLFVTKALYQVCRKACARFSFDRAYRSFVFWAQPALSRPLAFCKSVSFESMLIGFLVGVVIAASTPCVFGVCVTQISGLTDRARLFDPWCGHYTRNLPRAAAPMPAESSRL